MPINSISRAILINSSAILLVMNKFVFDGSHDVLHVDDFLGSLSFKKLLYNKRLIPLI